MPIYVYECKTCKKNFEVEQRITADPLTDCECGAKGSLKRLIQPTAILFKGSGFHINDYSSPSNSSSSSNTTKASSECSGNPTSCASCSPSEE